MLVFLCSEYVQFIKEDPGMSKIEISVEDCRFVVILFDRESGLINIRDIFQK